MPVSLRREIARKGGLAVHAQGKVRKPPRKHMIKIGSKGGASTALRGPEYMAEIGRKGGLVRQQRRRAATQEP